jgi:hypothetical protein
MLMLNSTAIADAVKALAAARVLARFCAISKAALAAKPPTANAFLAFFPAFGGFPTAGDTGG